MKRILLVNPWIHDFAAYDLWMKPLGLLYLGAILRGACPDIDIQVIDCLDPYRSAGRAQKRGLKRAPSGKGHFPKEILPKPPSLALVKRRYHRYGIPLQLFRDELADRNPDLIMVTSMMTYWHPGVAEAIRLLHEAFPGVPVLLGGNYASLCPEHAGAHSGADGIFSGEGEVHLAAILENYLGRTDAPLPDPRKLDSLPYPAFDLLGRFDQIPLLTARGCPYHCTYCASGLLNGLGFRQRDPIRVADEISHWHDRYGVRHFAFYDDALLVDSPSRAVPLMREIIRRKLDCGFHCPNGLHLREVNAEVAVLMRRAGFRTLRFGFETADASRQIETGNKVSTEELNSALRHLRNAGYAPEEIGVYILCGLPGQSVREIIQSIETVESCGGRPVLAEYSPIPGTRLWPEAVRSSPYPVAEEPLFHNNTLLPCADRGLTDEVYQQLKRRTRLAFCLEPVISC